MQEHVIVVHGLWMRGWMFGLLCRRLRQAGYVVHTLSYASTRTDPLEVIERLRLLAQSLPDVRLHWLGHSLGGLLVLRAVQQSESLPSGRIVTLGCPLRGSAVAEKLVALPFGKRLLGSAADILIDPKCELPIAREVGFIAGSRAIGLGRLLDHSGEPSDGAVRVSEARPPSPYPFIVLPVAHVWMLFSRQTIESAIDFFRTGQFIASPSSGRNRD